MRPNKLLIPEKKKRERIKKSLKELLLGFVFFVCTGVPASPLSNSSLEIFLQKGSDFFLLQRDFLLALQFCLCEFLIFKKRRNTHFTFFFFLNLVCYDLLSQWWFSKGKLWQVMQAPKSFGEKQVESDLENTAISRLSWRLLSLWRKFSWFENVFICIPPTILNRRLHITQNKCSS